jgi:hypothetical protein
MTETVQAVAAYLALFISIGSAIAALRVSREQTRMQAHLLRFETARERDRLAQQSQAEITAALARVGESVLLRIQNRGRAEGRALRVLVDGQDITMHDHFPDASAPPEVLGPDACFAFRRSTYDGLPDQYGIEVHWSDAGGEPRSWASRLSVAS